MVVIAGDTRHITTPANPIKVSGCMLTRPKAICFGRYCKACVARRRCQIPARCHAACASTLHEPGRSGAVLIDIPMDVFAGRVEGIPVTLARRPAFWRSEGPADGVAEAARLLAEATQPVIFVGNGVALSEASVELKMLAELLRAPVGDDADG